MSRSLVEARGLVKRFGVIDALCGVELDVAPGEVVSLLGPNGAGKSTLLRLLAGLARPTSGALRIASTQDRRRARAHVGYLGHATLLYPSLTARENLLFAGRLQNVASPGARADALLDELGLAAVANRPAGGFSRGMAQRLAIARALVHDPPLVLLDEPFTGLDRGGADRLAARLRDLRAQGRALVLVTHELARAAEISDAALLLSRGRIVFGARGAALTAAALEQAWEQHVGAGA